MRKTLSTAVVTALLIGVFVSSSCSFRQLGVSPALSAKLRDSGPQPLGVDNPYLAPNLFLAKAAEANPELLGFLENRGAPDAIEVVSRFLASDQITLLYHRSAQRYEMEYGDDIWIIRGPYPLPAGSVASNRGTNRDEQVVPLLMIGGKLLPPPVVQDRTTATERTSGVADAPFTSPQLPLTPTPDAVALSTPLPATSVPPRTTPTRSPTQPPTASPTSSPPPTSTATPRRTPSPSPTQTPRPTVSPTKAPRPIAKLPEPMPDALPPPELSAPLTDSTAEQGEHLDSPKPTPAGLRAGGTEPGFAALIELHGSSPAEITPKGDLVHYVTFEGETLEIIARWYSGDVSNAERLGRMNRLSATQALVPGDTVIVPAYMVRNSYRLSEGGMRALGGAATAPIEEPSRINQQPSELRSDELLLEERAADERSDDDQAYDLESQ